MAEEIDELKQRVLRVHLADMKESGTEEETDYFKRGYLDENSEATPLGSEFLTLFDAGMLTREGQLTDEGQVYATSYRDSLDADPSVYKRREERGLNTIDKDAGGDTGGFWSMLGDFATQGVPRMAETFYNAYAAPAIETATIVPRSIYQAVTGTDPTLPRTQTVDETINSISENLTGGVLASEPLAAGAIYGSEKIAAQIQGKKEEAYAAKQQWEKHNAEITELKGADMMNFLTGADQWMKSRDALVAAQGEDAVKKNEEFDRMAGNFILDPNNIVSMGMGKAVEAGAAGLSRATLAAEKLALRARVLNAGVAASALERATLEAGATKAAATIQTATERAAALRTIGNEAQALRYEGVAQRIGEKAQGLAGRITELTATEAKLAGELESIGSKAGVAEAIVSVNQKLAAIRQLPAQALGQIAESVGTGLVKTDAFLADALEQSGLKSLQQSYGVMRSLPGRMFSLLLGPVGHAAGIVSQVVSSGPLLQSVGNFSKVLGRELIQERGTVPFWKRVASNSTLTVPQRFLAHRMDEMTLGGMVAEIGRPVVRATAFAYPMNLAFEVLQDPNQDIGAAAQRAFAPSLVFGGGMAGAGAMFKGSKERMKAIRIGDEINFTRGLTDEQKSGFSAMSRGGKRMVSTYAAAFPNLNWEFTPDAPSRYDSATNTVRINPASPNPLRALVGHEVLHYVTIRNQMQPVIHSMLLGDAETPGLLRHTDGSLAPEFQKFADAYQDRMDAAGLERVPLEKLAEEYFIEATVDHLTGMVESGEFSRMAGKTQLGRKIQSFIEATMPRTAILKDFFFRSGGAMEAGGRHVMGNGLLADGIRELPEARAMMRKLVRSSAGEAVTTANNKVSTPKDGAGFELPVAKGDPIIDSFHAILETDTNGVPIRDKDGDHVALSRAKDQARESAGHIITEAQTRRVKEGYLPSPNEIQMLPDGAWEGQHIPRPLIDALAAKGILNSKQIAILRNISTATKTGQGIRYLITNHPATAKTKGGKIRYATLGATLRETVPTGFRITKDGNILVKLMNVEQLDRNIQTRAASKRGKALYDGNTEVIKQDIAAMMEIHADPNPDAKRTDGYYQARYGPARWMEYKNFINTVFGELASSQRAENPMLQEDGVGQRQQVYRTYRLDRISKATKMDGTPMPFGYTYVKANYLPDGLPASTISGGIDEHGQQ